VIRRALAAADVVGLSLAFLVTEMLFAPRSGIADRYPLSREVGLFAATLPVWIVVARLYGLYDRDEQRANHSSVDDLCGVLQLITIGSWLTFGVMSLDHLGNPSLPKLFTFWALAIGVVTSARVFARAICRRRPSYREKAVIVGGGDVAQLIARKVLQHPEYGIDLAGFVDLDPKERAFDVRSVPILGSPAELPSMIRRLGIRRVIVAFSSDGHDAALQLIRALRMLDVQVDLVPRLFELLPETARIHTLEGLPLIGLPRPRLSRSSQLLKRTTDLAISATLLVLLSPLLLFISLLIKVDSSGPVFFRQVRMGSRDHEFRILKFRTMIDEADQRKAEVAHLNKHAANGGDPRMFKIPNDPRTTRVGRFLRRYSLDELPQLVNVLKGEMSLVGPRPLILDEDRYVADWARTRLELKPGITGLWQVLGRDSIPFDEMVRLDYLYVTTWSLWGDLRLLLGTLPAVSRGERAPLHATQGSVPTL
jgi:exopolysaccharide biosynthesis polyprenyl glycosylphosphotransferase